MRRDGTPAGRRHRTLLWVGLLLCVGSHSASAADCPGNRNALGTSRTLVVDPREHPRIGSMQYPESLPLQDHEVVLTFDDGPLPRNSNQVLAILASQCVKATFFTIGRMAQAYPEGVRKLVEAGHTVGTHTQNHPLTMDKMPIERAREEIEEGIASVKSALGNDAALAPFFRIPGLLRAEGVEQYLAAEGIQIWSADFLADDWRHISSSRIYELAMKRLEAKGKGVLLLHDIQARTVAALPRILRELKARGYRIVHVVPATPDSPATPTEPHQWQHAPSEHLSSSDWPLIPDFAAKDQSAAPAQWAFDWRTAYSSNPAHRERQVSRDVSAQPRPAWPRHWRLPPEDTAIILSIPAQSVFQIPEGLHAAAKGLLSAHLSAKLATGDHRPNSSQAANQKRAHHGRPARASKHGRERSAQASRQRRGKLKDPLRARKRSR